MNDKQQIEKDIVEMVRLMGENWFNETIPDCAERLYNANYRKLPENAVVLTREELAKERELNRQIDREFVISEFNAQVRTSIEKTRKETAREIYQELQGHGTTYVKKWIKEHYGVGGNNEK